MTQHEPQWQPVSLGGDVPPPVGAYSAAVRAGDFIYVSGQVPRDFMTGETIGDDIESQTKYVIGNVKRVLEAAGASLRDIVSVIVYLNDIDDWGRFNDTYRSLMSPPYPTRTAVGSNLRGFMVEISAVAYKPVQR